MDIDRELGSVAGPQVLIALRVDRLVVDLRARRCGALRNHRERTRSLPSGANPITGRRLHVAEQDAAQAVGALRDHGMTGSVEEGDALLRAEAGRVHLTNAPMGAEPRGGSACGAG